MKKFIFAIALIWIFVYVWNFPTGFGGRLGIQYRLLLANSLLLAPILTATLTSLLFAYFYPRKFFQPHSSRPWAVMILGFTAGAMSVFTGMFGIAFADRFAPDWTIVALCSFICTLAVLKFMPRYIPGICQACHYDIRFALAAGRCPECGLSI